MELATDVGQAADLSDALTEAHFVAGVGITDELDPPVAQEGSGVLTRPARGEVVDR